MTSDTESRFPEFPDSPSNKETDSLLGRGVALNIPNSREWLRTSCYLTSSKKLNFSRPLIYMIAVVAVCCGVCAVVLHPHRVAKLAVTIRRCLFGKSSNLHD